MDGAEEIPQPVHPEKKPRTVDAGTQGHSATQAVVTVTKVLDDDNLLGEIIVRVGLPTTLVRAALGCKRWLGHASDHKFLDRFRKLHPPRLLGYYIAEGASSEGLDSPRFVPMQPQPPELATVVRRLESYGFGMHDIMQCRNGSVFTRRRRGFGWRHGVHRPLCARKGTQFVPPLPHTQDHCRQKFGAIISEDEGSSSLSYLYLLGESTGVAGKTVARVYLLQDGVWRMRTSATCLHSLHLGTKALLVDSKIYVLTARSDEIIVLDLTASSFSAIPFPGVKYHYFKSKLSRADAASSVYLIHVEEFQLRVWLHKGDTWLLVHTPR